MSAQNSLESLHTCWLVLEYSPQKGALNLYVEHLQNACLPSSDVLHTPLFLHGFGVHLSCMTTPANRNITSNAIQ